MCQAHAVPQASGDDAGAFIDRLLASALGTFDIFAIYVGDRLGYYQALAASGPLTSTGLADATETNELYAREWLEQQTVSGVLDVEDENADALKRRYSLPAGPAEVLTQKDSLNYLAPIAQLIVGATTPLQQVLDAYRTGAGVRYGDYGTDLVDGQARMNRSMFINLMGTEWFPGVPELHNRLQSDPPAKIADIGCGAAWSSIGLANHYPKVEVDGFDLDELSVEAAKMNIEDAGVTYRVTCEFRDAGSLDYSNQYDLVAAFECIHDMGNPVAALSAMRNAVKDDGYVVVVDERVGDTFKAEPGDVERMMYGWSFLHCLPVGLVDEPRVGTGTVMRPGTLKKYALDAGFKDIEILPIENDFFRFYSLIQ